ncbi:hypothetical protein [Streptomyces sp. NPDC046371]|uniref:hypothetical protein n=1 Tax=Streptomyces sp. NPDC046371 TaxID=3154916 RepID=UPI0033D27E7A
MTVDAQSLAPDLIARTEAAATDIARLAVDTGITFSVDDVVAAVERALPADYPAPTRDDLTRRDVIARLAQRILTGELYEGTGIAEQ